MDINQMTTDEIESFLTVRRESIADWRAAQMLDDPNFENDWEEYKMECGPDLPQMES